MAAVASVIDTMVMPKPMLFCSASALPTSRGGQAAADSAENCGESATTATPHTTSSTNATATPAPASTG
jgi:hypothetical protein